MRSAITLLLLLISISVYSQTKPTQSQGDLAALDAKNGFRNYKFGTHISSFPDFVLKNKTKYTNVYTKPNENLFLNDYPIDFIEYLFEQDKLVAINLVYDNTASLIAGIDLLQQLYGLPKDVESEGNQHSATWKGNKVWIHSLVNLDSKAGNIFIVTKDYILKSVNVNRSKSNQD